MEQTNKELKPCPFEKGEIVEVRDYDHENWYLRRFLYIDEDGRYVCFSSTTPGYPFAWLQCRKPKPYKEENSETNKKPLIYICSAYRGEIGNNTRKAREFSRFAMEEGVIPIAPHLLFPQFLSEDTEREVAMEMDILLLSRCDGLWVFNRPTEGMKSEIAYAKANGIPIRYFEEDGWSLSFDDRTFASGLMPAAVNTVKIRLKEVQNDGE